MEINKEIKDFMDKFININDYRLDKARKTTATLSEFLRNNLKWYQDSAYQWSFSYYTIIKPDPDTDGWKYDVDLAVELSYNKDYQWWEKKYYKNVYECLKDSERYSSKVSNEKERAVRVYYESDDWEFYVDLVPMFQEDWKWRVINHIANKKEISWWFLFRDWVNEQNNKTSIEWSQEKFLKKIIRIFKFFRNQKSISDIKSVQLTLLLSRQVDKLDNNCFSSISNTLYSISKSLKEELEWCNSVDDLDLSNPALPEEVFDRNFDENKFQEFKNSAISLIDVIILAYECEDEEKSFSLWQSVFWDWLTSNINKTLAVYNFDHAQNPTDIWCFYKRLPYYFKLKCRYYFWKSPWAMYEDKKHWKKIVKLSKIQFFTTKIPNNIPKQNVLWQVTNNNQSNEIRWEIWKPNKNLHYQKQLWWFAIEETAAYPWRHRVKCYIINDAREIIAESDKFYINIQK